jgi:hypothetical protein
MNRNNCQLVLDYINRLKYDAQQDNTKFRLENYDVRYINWLNTINKKVYDIIDIELHELCDQDYQQMFMDDYHVDEVTKIIVDDFMMSY